MNYYTGRVSKGIALMAKLMAPSRPVMNFYHDVTGMHLHRGSLNIQLDYEVNLSDYSQVRLRRDSGKIMPIYMIPATIAGLECYIVRSELVRLGLGIHPKSVIEVISPYHFRRMLKLSDGDKVSVRPKGVKHVSHSVKIDPVERITGEINNSGSKNSAVTAMLASLLTEDEIVFQNVPNIDSLNRTIFLLQNIGADISIDSGKINISAKTISRIDLTDSYYRHRSGLLVACAMLARTQRVKVPYPGGDSIGSRPYDILINSLKKMNIDCNINIEGYDFKTKRIIGTKLVLNYPSVTSTAGLLFAAVKAKGTTIIKNYSKMPETYDLIKLLNQMGAKITEDRQQKLVIEGVTKLHGTDFKFMPDNNEAVSYAIAAIATGGNIFIKNVCTNDLMPFLNILDKIGACYEIKNDGIRFWAKKGSLKSTDISTSAWPGISTDWQPQLTVLMTQARGISTLHETVFENRFRYINCLNKIGGKITHQTNCKHSSNCRLARNSRSHSVTVKGNTRFTGGLVNSYDIRADFALVIAGLISNNSLVIKSEKQLELGYENFINKFKKLGASISLVD